jgi:hypothetical protein
MLHPEKVKDPHGTPEFYKKVNITSLLGLIPHNRPEKGKGSHSHFAKLFSVGTQFFDNLILFHVAYSCRRHNAVDTMSPGEINCQRA